MEESKFPPIDLEIETAVHLFMKKNPHMTRYYERMMRVDPERALQEIMCRTMSRMEELEKLADQLKPLVKEWVQQTPGLHERIEMRLKTRVLFPNVAYIEEAVRAREQMDSTVPRASATSDTAT